MPWEAVQAARQAPRGQQVCIPRPCWAHVSVPAGPSLAPFNGVLVITAAEETTPGLSGAELYLSFEAYGVCRSGIWVQQVCLAHLSTMSGPLRKGLHSSGNSQSRALERPRDSLSQLPGIGDEVSRRLGLTCLHVASPCGFGFICGPRGWPDSLCDGSGSQGTMFSEWGRSYMASEDTQHHIDTPKAK